MRRRCPLEQTHKREKFVELAEKRVNRAIKDIRLISNLANKNNYMYTEQDVAKIISVLEQELKSLKTRFSIDDIKQALTFKL